MPFDFSQNQHNQLVTVHLELIEGFNQQFPNGLPVIKFGFWKVAFCAALNICLPETPALAAARSSLIPAYDLCRYFYNLEKEISQCFLLLYADEAVNFISLKSQSHRRAHTWQDNDIVEFLYQTFKTQPMHNIASTQV